MDEGRIGWLLGGHFADTAATINNAIASMTLFDRKPVSERIAPTVISALQAIDREEFVPRMIDRAGSSGQG